MLDNSMISGLIKPLITLLDEYGISAKMLFSDAELNPLPRVKQSSQTTQPQAVRAQMSVSALERARKLTKEPAIALYYGQRVSISSLGTLGFALMSCTDIASVLRLLIRYHPILTSELSWELCEEFCDELGEGLADDARGVTLRAQFHSGNRDQQRLLIESHFSSINAIGTYFLNRPMFGVELHLNYSAPEYADIYQQIFAVPVLFDQANCQLLMNNELLDFKLVTANPGSQVFFRQQCELLLSELNAEENIAAEVRRLLMHASGNFPDITQVASALFMSERTLRRRLKAEGTSFRRLFDEVRNVLAQEYLTATAITVAEIADLLGYTECANFRRAFIRWNRITPIEYRLQSN